MRRLEIFRSRDVLKSKEEWRGSALDWRESRGGESWVSYLLFDVRRLKQFMVGRPSARQLRIMLGLRNGDLIWEVPRRECFTQFSEHLGRTVKLRNEELNALIQEGWIARVQHLPAEQRLDFFELTAAGRLVSEEPTRKGPQRGRAESYAPKISRRV